MTATRRFNVWRKVVVATLLGDAVVATVDHRTAVWAATAVALIALTAMLALLWTTPADAIVLPRGRSERIIAGAAVALYAIASLRVDEPRVVVGLLAMATIALGLLATRATSISAWWIAPVAWNPFVIAMIASADRAL